MKCGYTSRRIDGLVLSVVNGNAKLRWLTFSCLKQDYGLIPVPQGHVPVLKVHTVLHGVAHFWFLHEEVGHSRLYASLGREIIEVLEFEVIGIHRPV